MSRRTKYIIGGVAVGVVAWWLLPTWLALLIILGVVVAPAVGYLMLDPSQRRRLRRVARKQIDR